MLAKAGWTKSMISLDTKQAALFAISKRWYVKIEAFEDCPFTREELAVSAATYLNQIPADTPDDPLRAINIIVSFLPTCCTKLFSQGTLTCPFCMACCETSIPTVISNVSWTMEGWVDLATTLKQADPIPWEFQHGWHREDCDRSDHLACVTSWGSWILVELQLSKPEFFPPLLESLQLPSDQSLSTLDARVIGLVCSNKKNADSSRHYWLVEMENGQPLYVYDPLQGVQRLAQEVAKKLFVTGVLLAAGPIKTPTLRTPDLDFAAGFVPPLLRERNPIKVVGRQQASRIRNFLCRKEGTGGKKQKKV